MKDWWNARSTAQQTWIVFGSLVVVIALLVGGGSSDNKKSSNSSADIAAPTAATTAATAPAVELSVTRPHDEQRIVSKQFGAAGHAAPGTPVTVSLGASKYHATTGNDGAWRVRHIPAPSSTSARLTAETRDDIKFLSLKFGRPPPPPPPPAPPSADEIAADKARTARSEIRLAVGDADLLGKNVKVSFSSTGNHHFDVKITYKLADNLTKGLIESGAKDDAKKLFQAVFDGHDDGLADGATVNATSTLVDTFGHESTGVAYGLFMPGVLGRQINWSNQAEVDFGQAWTHTIDRIG